MNAIECLKEISKGGPYFLYDLDALSEHAQKLNQSECKLFLLARPTL